MLIPYLFPLDRLVLQHHWVRADVRLHGYFVAAGNLLHPRGGSDSRRYTTADYVALGWSEAAWCDSRGGDRCQGDCDGCGLCFWDSMARGGAYGQSQALRWVVVVGFIV